MATYYKPQSPIQSGEDFIYPITTADQIMKSDNSRLEQNGEIIADNSPKLGGIAANEYALKTKTVPTSRTVNGKALSGDITLAFSNLQNEFEGDGSTSEGGYLAFAQLEITGNYANKPIEFELISRGRPTSCLVSVQFENVNSTDPGLKKIYYRGSSYGVFIQKTGTGTWVLYYKKDGTYDKLTVKRVSSASQSITITYTGSHVTSKPTSNVTDAVPYELEKTYPVGSIYLSVNSTSPASLFGGTWESIGGRFLLGADATYTAGSTGGSATHQHSYGFQYGAYYGALGLEHSDANTAGLLSYDNNNNITLTGYSTSSQGGKEARINGAATTSTKVVSMMHQRMVANTSNISNMPPYLAVYMWKRVS